MRSCATSPDPRTQKGFTLLEMTLAISVSGLLVALMVSVWMQIFRTSTAVQKETGLLRAEESQLRTLQRILDGAQWSAASLTPGGAMPWHQAGQSFAFWSRETGGSSPGPVLWTFEGLELAKWRDPSGLQGEFPLSGIQALSLEVMRVQGSLEGERLEWILPSQWDPGVPFRPLGLRLRVRWTSGREACLQGAP